MKLLLVEDDRRLGELLSNTLRQHKHRVDWVQDGEEGWAYADAGSYDLIILDVILPNLSGVDLCRKLRANNHPEPILMLTAQDTSSDKVAALDAGADDYVVKPFDLPELLARIRALSRRGHGLVTTPSILEWERLQLDPRSCKVTYAGQPIPLTPKEYGLLELFLRHEGRVFSLNAILDQLWTFEDSPGERTVRVHIKGLRQKLKAAGVPAQIIETVYGLGYRLGAPPQVSADANNSADPSDRVDPGASVDQIRSPDPQRSSASSLDTPQGAASLIHSGSGSEAPSAADRAHDDPASASLDLPDIVDPQDPEDPERQDDQTSARISMMQAALAQAWKKFKPETLDQLAQVEAVLQAWEQGEWNTFQHQQTFQAIHQLTGLLGTYGLNSGSQIAAEIKGILETQTEPAPGQLTQLHDRINRLQAMVNHESSSCCCKQSAADNP